MTLVVGAVCKDGVVIVADKKVVEGGDVTSQDKIHLLPNLGVGFSGAGLSDLLEKFLNRTFINIEEKNKALRRQLIEQNPKIKEEEINQIVSPYAYANQFVEDCEGILMGIKSNYQDIVQKYPNSLQILLGFRGGNEAELHYLDIDGCLDSPRKTFMAIGSGSPYAQTFLKEVWNENITMEQMAKIICFIVKYVETSRLDNFVGEGVQALFVPKLDKRFQELSEKETQGLSLTPDETKEVQQYYVRTIDLSISYNEIINKRVNEFKEIFSKLREL